MGGDQSKVTRGATIALAIATSWLDLPVMASVLAGVGIYQSLKAGSNPAKDLGAFARDIIRGFGAIATEEKSVIEYPARALRGLTGRSPITLAKSGLDLPTEWLGKLATKPCKVGILGDEGEGKSYLLRYFLYRFLAAHDFDLSRCRVFVHDVEGGLGHGERSSWLGLPEGSQVFNDPSDFLAILEQIQESIDRPDFKPTLLLVDEFNNLLDEFDKSDRAVIDSHLKQIRNRGKKRAISLVFGTQDANVVDLGLSSAAVRRLDWVTLPKMATSASNFRNLGLSAETEKHRAELATKLKTIDKSGGCYPALLYCDRSFFLVRIPDLSGLPKTLPIEEEKTPDQWWAEFSAEHPEITPDNYQSARKLTEAVNAILRGNGEALIKRSNDDPRYCLIKALMARDDGTNHGEPMVIANNPNQNHPAETTEPPAAGYWLPSEVQLQNTLIKE